MRLNFMFFCVWSSYNRNNSKIYSDIASIELGINLGRLGKTYKQKGNILDTNFFIIRFTLAIFLCLSWFLM